MKNFRKSELWDSILETNNFKKIDLHTFKDEGVNARITQYSHKTHSLLFLKSLLFQMASSFHNNEISLLSKIPNRDIGGGISIEYKKIRLDLDYLLALEEVIFLKNKLKKTKSILEIGAGYGRTCHTILSIYPNISEYTIIDLPEMLGLSRAYLKKVSSSENFKKINFIPIQNIKKGNFDLIINIDSMQEMDEKTAKSYLNYINNCSNAFYTKNTVGKFNPDICGFKKSKASDLASRSGLLRNKINIFCPDALEKAQKKFLLKFVPEKKWKIEKQAKTLPWPHYYQALFVKNE